MPRCAILLLLLVCACKSDLEKLVARHHDKLEAQLDKAAALAPIVEKQPKLTADQWPVPGVKFTNPYDAQDHSGNAFWEWSNQLVDPCTNWTTTYAKDNSGNDFILVTDTLLDTTGGLLEKPSCALTGNMQRAAGLDEKQASYLENARYVLVLRLAIKQKPELDQAEVKADVDAYIASGKGKDVSHFVPGRLAGDALLYELATAKLAGGFTFDVTSSDEVSIQGAGLDEIREDLDKHLATVLAAKLAM